MLFSASIVLLVHSPLAIAEAGNSSPPAPDISTVEGQSVLSPLPDSPTLKPLVSSTPLVTPVTPPPDTVQPLADDPPEVAFAPRRSVIISAFQTTGGPQFIELYNSDSKSPIDVDGWKIVASFSDSECSIPLQGVILSKTKVVIASQNAPPDLVNAHWFDCGATSGKVVQKLRMYDHGALVERLNISNPGTQQWQRKGLTKSYKTGNFTNDFKAIPDEPTSDDPSPVGIKLDDDAWYSLPTKPTLAVTEVLVSPRDCLPTDVGADCYDYVKLKNTGPNAIDLSQYRLRTGYANADSRSTNTIQLSRVIGAGDTVRIDHNADGSPVSISANDGTVWLEDIYGLESFDLKVPPYIGSNSTTHEGQSWAYDSSDSSWKWAVPSPTIVSNNFALPGVGGAGLPDEPQYKPCDSNQYRSSETHRCRLKATTSSSLVPCQSNQYRSPETNRCRSLASVASAKLKPCKPNQTRNPQTNRCRSVLGVSTKLKLCAADQERNPDTNRCRKVQTKTASANFAVEPIKQGVKSFVGWWALGGLAVLAAGYATWEWRDEIRRAIVRVASFAGSRR